MATDAQRARRRAQREIAKVVRENKARKKAGIKPVRILPPTTTKTAREAPAKYGYSVLNGTNPYPVKESKEGNQLARLASLASHGKADPAFLAAFQQYFYHDENHTDNDDLDEYDEDGE
jgi:hypothetical protein